MLFIVFIPRTLQLNINWPIILHSLYLSSGHLVFIFGMTMTILPSILGCNDSIVKFILDT